MQWRNLPTPAILTIHNLAYQGLFSRETLARIGAPDAAFDVNGVEFYDKVSFLKAGIFYAAHVTTVSETYAREITTPELGCGLDGLLRVRAEQDELTGILNGIDESWDPRTCPDLPRNFDAGRNLGAAHATPTMSGSGSGWRWREGPLFGLVSRLVHQKGVDFVISAAESIVGAGGQIVVTGNGERRFEDALDQLRQRFPGSVGVASFDERDARTIYAGSDFTLMPSRFEPCGLSQMYAQRFGSLPIGYRTGGLAETIDDGTHRLPVRPTVGSRPSSARYAGPSPSTRIARASTRCGARRWGAPTAGTDPQAPTRGFIDSSRPDSP